MKITHASQEFEIALAEAIKAALLKTDMAMGKKSNNSHNVGLKPPLALAKAILADPLFCMVLKGLNKE